MANSYYCWSFPVGPISLAEADGAVVNLCFGETPDAGYTQCARREETPALKLAASQLREYFSRARKEFTVPLRADGTNFQKLVWSELKKIPYGQTRAYAEIAAAVGRPGAWRAVAMANRSNPTPIFIPCHRVIGSDGSLRGYAGGIKIKERLLALENAVNTLAPLDF